MSFQFSLMFLANVVFDSYMTLNYNLAEQSGGCVTVNTSCCNWISSTGQGEANVIYYHARWPHSFG